MADIDRSTREGDARPAVVRWFRGMRARPRLWISAAVGLAIYGLLPHIAAFVGQARSLVAWNAGAILYLLLAWQLTYGADANADAVQAHAPEQDEGRYTILALVVLAAAAVLVAVGSQLAEVRGMTGSMRRFHIALAVLTVATSWTFTHVLFALHYAHGFYLGRASGQGEGLAFPNTPEPAYSDFLYFAMVIGTSGQTADVAFTSSAMRRIGTLHCVLAFFFNATLLALTINLAAGLLA